MPITYKNIKKSVVWGIAPYIIIILILITIYYLLENIYEKFQYDPKIDTLLNKVKPLFTNNNKFTGNLTPLNDRNILNEVKVMKGDKSYTINKKKVYLCLKDENQNYYNDNILIYVFLHELSHVICDEVGHTQKFHDIFENILDLASEKGIYNPSIPMIDNYCLNS